MQTWISASKINMENLAELYASLYAQGFISNYTAGYEALQKLLFALVKKEWR